MRQRILKRQLADEFLLAPLSKVLLVDDDDADLQYHSQILEGQGHKVSACGSYPLGADLAERGDFDIIMVGQGSPAFEGRLIIERLRAQNLATPVLVLARCKEMRCYLEAMQLGAADYVEKPVHPAEMRRILRLHLQPSFASQ